MHLNSAGCIFRWRDWAVTCNISQQEKHFGEAVILRFSAYFLLGFNKKVVSKWLGEKTQSLEKIFTWRKKFFKTKILTDYYNVQGMALWTQRDQMHLVYFLERRKLGSTQSHLKGTSDRTGSLVGHLFLRFSPREQPPQVVELDAFESGETSLPLLCPETDRSIFQNIHTHTHSTSNSSIYIFLISCFISPLHTQFKLMEMMLTENWSLLN